MTYNLKQAALYLLCAAFILAFINLGFWQLDRAEEKRIKQHSYFMQQALPPITEDELFFDHADNLDLQAIQYRQLLLTGKFDSTYTLLLDNQTYKGKYGFSVLTLFRTPNANFLIDRGWIKAMPDRTTLPTLTTPSTLQTLNTRISTKNITRPDSASEPPPKAHSVQIIQSLKLNLPPQSFPILLQLEPRQTASFTHRLQHVKFSPEKHTAYAFQWFAMAFALFICSLKLYRTKK